MSGRIKRKLARLQVCYCPAILVICQHLVDKETTEQTSINQAPTFKNENGGVLPSRPLFFLPPVSFFLSLFLRLPLAFSPPPPYFPLFLPFLYPSSLPLPSLFSLPLKIPASNGGEL